MKVIELDTANLMMSVQAAQRERVMITRRGKPIALIIGVEGFDDEQLELGNSDAFWQLITGRRAQKTISRAELESQLEQS